MTNTLTLTHSEAVTLLNELQAVLQTKNLDTVQIVSTANNIHVSVLKSETTEHPYDFTNK